MNRKELAREIKTIAVKLPPVKEEHVSGFTHEDKTNFKPHKYLVDVNHERRLRKAYESYGMEGIKRYLEQINNLQKKRNEEISKQDSEAQAG